MPYHPSQEPTYRKPIITVRLTRGGFFNSGLNLPMHKYIRGFNMQWGVDSSFSVTLRIFDPEHDTVERFLHASGAGTHVRYSFGWRDGSVSQEYVGLVKQYASKVLPGGSEIEFTIQSPISAAAAARPDIVFGLRRVDDAVNFVCQEIGIPFKNRVIEPTVDTLLQLPDFLGSEGHTFKFWLSEILEYAHSARGNDYGPYTYRFDPDGKFRFTTIARTDGLNMRLYDTYAYGFASDGRVLDFELIDVRPLMALTGGQYVVSRTVDPDKPEDHRDVVDPTGGLAVTSTEAATQGIAANQAEDQGVSSEQAQAPTDDIVIDNSEAIIRAVSKWRLFTGYNFSVTMTILGDPHVRLGDFVYVRIVKRDGTSHFMSGLYLIRNIVHDMDDTKYTTALTMMRRGSFIGDVQQARVTLPSSLAQQLDRNLPGFNVSPNYRFQLGRYYYSETTGQIVFPEDGGENFELSPNITTRIPDYVPPIPGTEGAPHRHAPVEDEEEQ